MQTDRCQQYDWKQSYFVTFESGEKDWIVMDGESENNELIRGNGSND